MHSLVIKSDVFQYSYIQLYVSRCVRIYLYCDVMSFMPNNSESFMSLT